MEIIIRNRNLYVRHDGQLWRIGRNGVVKENRMDSIKTLKALVAKRESSGDHVYVDVLALLTIAEQLERIADALEKPPAVTYHMASDGLDAYREHKSVFPPPEVFDCSDFRDERGVCDAKCADTDVCPDHTPF